MVLCYSTARPRDMQPLVAWISQMRNFELDSKIVDAYDFMQILLEVTRILRFPDFTGILQGFYTDFMWILQTSCNVVCQ